MLINWFTVIAQIVNFLVLVWLLKRYLYQPILKAIDEREKKIAARINDAEKKEADAKTEKDEFKKKNDAFDNDRDDLMKKADEEAKVEKNRFLQEAKKEALALREKLEKILKEDQHNLENEIAKRTRIEVFAIARKTLKDLADGDLEEQMVKVFIKRLQNPDKDEQKKLIAAFKSSHQPVIVRSTFELTASQHAEIKKSFKEESGHAPKFQFEITPELISGIEMKVNGYKVEWNISKYLSSVKNSIGEIVKRKAIRSVSDNEEKESDKSEDKEVSNPEDKEAVKAKDKNITREGDELREKVKAKPQEGESIESENKKGK